MKKKKSLKPMSLEGRPLLGHCGSVEVMNPLIVQASHGGEAQW